MRNASILRLILTLHVAAFLAAFAPGAARAAEGGGAQCPWGSDLNFSVDGKKVTVPQSLFTAKVKQSTIGGFEVMADTNNLKLILVAPNGDTWEAALTVVDGGKRCIAFYAGDVYPVGGAAVPVVALDPPEGRSAARR